MPRYVVSSFGRTYIIDEDLVNLSIIRWIFTIVTALVGIIALSRFLLFLTAKTSSSLRFSNLLKSTGGRVILVYITSHLIHSIHYVDNIYRPVAYLEPKWLYQKYVISEMEITFFVNFPITFVGLYFMERLVSGINGERYSDISNACKKMIWYILGSLLTLGHYLTEPPWKYSGFVNFTIAGEGIATILLAIFLHQLSKESVLKKKLALDLDMEQTAGLLDDDQNRRETSVQFEGVRSRTPIKH